MDIYNALREQRLARRNREASPHLKQGYGRNPSSGERREYTTVLVLHGFGVIEFNPTSYAEAQRTARVASQAGWTTWVAPCVLQTARYGRDVETDAAFAKRMLDNRRRMHDPSKAKCDRGCTAHPHEEPDGWQCPECSVWSHSPGEAREHNCSCDPLAHAYVQSPDFEHCAKCGHGYTSHRAPSLLRLGRSE